jgi:hypothetical protein
VDADQEHEEGERLGEEVPGGDKPDPVMGLLIDDDGQVQRAVHQDDDQGGEDQRDLVADHLGGGSEAA